MSCKSCKIEGCNDGYKPTLNGDGTKCECECHMPSDKGWEKTLEKVYWGKASLDVWKVTVRAMVKDLRQSDCQKLVELAGELDTIPPFAGNHELVMLEDVKKLIKSYYGEGE